MNLTDSSTVIDQGGPVGSLREALIGAWQLVASGSGAWPPRFSARTGAGRGSSNWRGAARVSPNDLARAFATVLERPVRAETVPRENWEQIFRSQGTRNPLPRIRMLDGFNEGWVEFSDNGRSAVKGTTTLDSVIAELVEASRAKAAA
jgi:hypothetical protein